MLWVLELADQPQFPVRSLAPWDTHSPATLGLSEAVIILHLSGAHRLE